MGTTAVEAEQQGLPNMQPGFLHYRIEQTGPTAWQVIAVFAGSQGQALQPVFSSQLEAVRAAFSYNRQARRQNRTAS